MLGIHSGNGNSPARNECVLVGDKPDTEYLSQSYISQLQRDGQLRQKPIVWIDCPSTFGESVCCSLVAVVVIVGLSLSFFVAEPYLLLEGKILYVLVLTAVIFLMLQLTTSALLDAWQCRQRFQDDLFHAIQHRDFPVYADLEKHARKFFSKYLKDEDAIKEGLAKKYANRRYVQYLVRLFDRGGSTIIFWFEEKYLGFKIAEMEITRVSADEYNSRRVNEEYLRARREQACRADLDEQARRRHGDHQPTDPWEF